MVVVVVGVGGMPSRLKEYAGMCGWTYMVVGEGGGYDHFEMHLSRQKHGGGSGELRLKKTFPAPLALSFREGGGGRVRTAPGSPQPPPPEYGGV